MITLREVPAGILCESGSLGYTFLFAPAQPVLAQRYSANASGGGQAQTRLRSP